MGWGTHRGGGRGTEGPEAGGNAGAGWDGEGVGLTDLTRVDVGPRGKRVGVVGRGGRGGHLRPGGCSRGPGEPTGKVLKPRPMWTLDN